MAMRCMSVGLWQGLGILFQWSLCWNMHAADVRLSRWLECLSKHTAEAAHQGWLSE